VSVVEDVRKLLQDFLAPELREIATRIDALESIVAGNERSAEKRHEATAKNIDRLREEMASGFRQVLDYSVVQQRLAVLEQSLLPRVEALETAVKSRPAA